VSAASECLGGRGSGVRSHQHPRRAVTLFRNHGAPTTRAPTRRGTRPRVVVPTSAPFPSRPPKSDHQDLELGGGSGHLRDPGYGASSRPGGTSSLTRRCSGLASLAAELHSLGRPSLHLVTGSLTEGDTHGRSSSLTRSAVPSVSIGRHYSGASKRPQALPIRRFPAIRH